MRYKIGDYIRINDMLGEDNYKGRIGRITDIDDMGQLFGTWGGCAVIIEEDDITLLNNRANVFKKCEETNTRLEGINTLINYYIIYNHEEEDKVIKRILEMFDNGTIEEIKKLGKGW